MAATTVGTIEVLKAHGSRNDIFIVETGREGMAGMADLARWLCDRSGPLEGGDGVYFVATGSQPAQAWFVNPDGSDASFCGNGMRCVGRLLLERQQRDAVPVRSGAHEFTVRRAATTPEGVAQSLVELPPVDFTPDPPVVAGGASHVDAPLPTVHPTRRFTALAVPNPHLIAVVDSYDEAALVADGEQVAADSHGFPVGANVSHILPLAGGEIFVRTYERGAGLTLSCGSGVAAARAVCSRLGLFPAEQPVLVRNLGGVTRAWLDTTGQRWSPRIEGNASFVFRARVDPSHRSAGPVEPTGEDARFAALATANEQVLAAHGVVLRSAG